AGLLLAAGEGRRLGRPKALVEVGGALLVERGVAVLRAGGCAPVHAVLGAAYDAVVAAADLSGVVVVHNPDWRSGMGSSLRAGLAALPPDAGAVVVALADQPGVTPEGVRRLRTAYRGGARVAVATYGGSRRHPVLLARETWDEVARLAVGDVGARPFLAAHPVLVVPVACDDAGSPADIDTPEDLVRLTADPDSPILASPPSRRSARGRRCQDR
ncbi:MAG: nucleotidyltransferase family protein, partial [Carbonactinosporaceae bacterium]